MPIVAGLVLARLQDQEDLPEGIGDNTPAQNHRQLGPKLISDHLDKTLSETTLFFSIFYNPRKDNGQAF